MMRKKTTPIGGEQCGSHHRPQRIGGLAFSPEENKANEEGFISREENQCSR